VGEGHWHGGEDQHVGVALVEHLIEKVVDGEAVGTIVVAASSLGKARCKGGDLGLGDRINHMVEQVALHIEDELLSADRFLSCARLSRSLAWDPIAPAHRASCGLAGSRGACVEGHERDRGRTHRPQELTSRKAEPPGAVLALLPCDPHCFSRHLVQRPGTELVGATGAKLDGQTVTVDHVQAA
jgi:hypothetical protein